MKPPVSVVLFDAVGTLIYPDPPVGRAYYQIAFEFGCRLSEAEVTRRFHAAFKRAEQGQGVPRFVRPATDEAAERRRWQRIVAEVFGQQRLASDDAFFEALWQHFAAAGSWRMFAEVPAVWSELRRLGVQLGIASNFDQRLAALCRSMPPLDDSDHLFISSSVGVPKPSPLFFQRVEQRLGVRSEQILLVGDDLENDYHGALAAGWQAVFLQRESTDEALDGIDNLASLPAQLRSC